MGKFSLLVAIPALALECCDVAIHTDRVVCPHMRDPKPGTHDASKPIGAYYIGKDDHDNRLNFSVPTTLLDTRRTTPDAFVDFYGEFHRQRPGEPLSEWTTQVVDFVDAMSTSMRLVVCICHG